MTSSATGDQRLLGALAHGDFFVRSTALSLLSETVRPGIEATRLAIDAVDRYGPRDAFEFPHQICALPHDSDSLAWAIAALRADPPGDMDKVFCLQLSAWISRAPTGLLVDSKLQELELQGLDGLAKGWLVTPAGHALRRIELASKTSDECLELIHQGIGKITATSRTKTSPHAVVRDLELVCERLAADNPGQAIAEQILAWVEAECDFSSPESTDEWYAGFGIKLAGKLSIDAAIPAMLDKLDAGWDWWDEGIAAALVAMDGEIALASTIAAYPGGSQHVRKYLGGVLEKRRIPGFEADIIRLARLERDDAMRTDLGVALAAYGTEESMHQAQLIYADHPEDPDRFAIAEILYLFRSLQGEDSPSIRAWRTRQERNHQQLRRTRERFETGADSLLERPAAQASTQALVGRNDPCPCGSGKKFKKCCLGKS